MNLDYTTLIPTDFSDDSRVWVYQSSRIFTISEALEIEKKLEDFAQNWKSHQIPVKGFGTMFFGQFIILMADETAAGVSGCSTDSSVRLIKEIENTYQVNMFNRTSLAFVIKEKIQLLPLSQVNYAIENGFIDADTLFIDNNVPDKISLLTRWIIPVKDSWLGKKLYLSNDK
jgi:hypothetical protein